MSVLDKKIGPMVFQFPKFDRSQFPTQNHFLAVLVPFLQKLPLGYKFAVEIRNKDWIGNALGNSLRAHNVALVLQDLFYMPRPLELPEDFDPVTSDLIYVRWLGDRKGRRNSAHFFKSSRRSTTERSHVVVICSMYPEECRK